MWEVVGEFEENFAIYDVELESLIVTLIKEVILIFLSIYNKKNILLKLFIYTKICT